MIASRDRFCVVALGGDNLGDFAHILNDPAQTVRNAGSGPRAATSLDCGATAGSWSPTPPMASGKRAPSPMSSPHTGWEPRAPAIMNEDK